MCRPAICKTCGKTTWRGCGMHVEQVLSAVPRGQRCPGHPDAGQSQSWWKRLTRR